MTQRSQTLDSLSDVVRDFASLQFDAATERFVPALRTVSPETAVLLSRNLERMRDVFSVQLATEIAELIRTSDDASLELAIQKVQRLRLALSVNEIATGEVTAEEILQGYIKHDDGIIEFALPIGITVHEAGVLLNAHAEKLGMEYPVFDESCSKFWTANEKYRRTKTVPGRVYKVAIQRDAVELTRDEQVERYGAGAPFGVLAIAEACERLISGNESELFHTSDGTALWVRGMTPGKILSSNAYKGVGVSEHNNSYRSSYVGYASLADAVNQ